MAAHELQLQVQVAGTIMYNRKKTDEESIEFEKSRRERRETISKILKQG